jgi:hypothetical protein
MAFGLELASGWEIKPVARFFKGDHSDQIAAGEALQIRKDLALT